VFYCRVVTLLATAVVKRIEIGVGSATQPATPGESVGNARAIGFESWYLGLAEIH
jgi:hypothetical protein